VVQNRTLIQLAFGPPGVVDASLSVRARGLVGSEILKIAAEIRELVKAGKPVCNLTVGDFNPKYFPIPAVLLEEIQKALAAGETNYPPQDGVLALREAAAEFTAREMGVRYPVESVLIASGARPVLYGAYRCVVDPGETVVYPAPSWNNNHYVGLLGAVGVCLPTHVEDGFQPTLAQLKPHLATARMIVINTPLNPSGTVMSAENLRAIAQAIVNENARRAAAGQKHLFLLFDQVYGSLVFGHSKHDHPAALVPEIAPWLITVDGISKALAATGLRVGWVLAAPELTARLRDLIGHVGAWAPRPEQIAVAKFLRNESAVAAFRKEMDARVRGRLDALYEGFSALKAEGYPVRCVDPQGAIYLSLQIDVIGKSFDGQRSGGNESIRKLLLDHAGLGVVPFQAFGLDEETGWFRLSVGAVSMDEIAQMFPRVKALLDRIR
jgi:aspartate aminotransferase